MLAKIILIFIPKYKREQAVIEGIYGEFEWDDELTTQKNRELHNTFKEQCAVQYYKLSMDNIPLTNISYNYRRNLYNNREAFEVFMSIDSLKKENHVMKIENAYTKDGITYKRSIPFYKTK